MDEPVETIVMRGGPRPRGDPESDAARNTPEANRYWFVVGEVDLRVHPLERRQWPPASLAGGFK